MNVNYLWLQQKQAKEMIKIEKVWGLDNPADAFTKPLEWNGLQSAMIKINVKCTSEKQKRQHPLHKSHIEVNILQKTIHQDTHAEGWHYEIKNNDCEAGNQRNDHQANRVR